MNWRAFISDWIPIHRPEGKVVCVDVYVKGPNRKLDGLAWVIKEVDGSYRFLIHEDKLPDVEGVKDENTPLIFVHESSPIRFRVICSNSPA